MKAFAYILFAAFTYMGSATHMAEQPVGIEKQQLSAEETVKQDVIHNYMKANIEKDYKKQYELLSESSKQGLTLEQYIDIRKLDEQLGALLDYNLVRKIDDNSYLVEQKIKRFYLDGETENIVSDEKVVLENGKWKYQWSEARLKNNWNYRIIENYILLSLMYQEGIGKEKNAEKAKLNYEKAMKAITSDQEKSYLLGMAYALVEKYETSNELLEAFTKENKDNEMQIDAYHRLIVNNILLDDNEKVKYYARELMKINPSDEVAGEVLQQLEENKTTKE